MPPILCHVGEFRNSLSAPSLALLGQPIETFLRSIGKDNESRPLIDLSFDRSRLSRANIRESNQPTIAVWLHAALEDLTGNFSEDPGLRKSIGLIYADRWEGHPDVFGMMFDVGFKVDELGSVGTFKEVAREGCAVFLDAIRDYRRQRQNACDEEIHRQIMWTTIHELGHVFNLWHHDSPMRFMTPSDKDKIYDPNDPSQPDVEYEFLPQQRDFLKSCLAEGLSNPNAAHAWPGGTDFGTRGNNVTADQEFRSPHDLPRSRSEMEIRIEIAQEEFWAIDPIELDMEIRVPASNRRRYRLPDKLDPGYSSFALWIEEPDGCRFRYKSPRHYCENPGLITVAANQPFARDLSVFGQAGGYTFCKAGVHRLFATWVLPNGRVIESNHIEVNVKSQLEGRRDYAKRRPTLTHPDVARLLYHRSGPFRSKIVERIEDLAKSTRDRALEAALRYALGRFLNRSASARSKEARHKRHQQAERHLHRALDLGDALSSRRRFHAERVCDEIRQD